MLKMGRPVLEAINIDTLTRSNYIELLRKGYSVKDIFRELSKGSNMDDKLLREEFDYWRKGNGILDLKSTRIKEY